MSKRGIHDLGGLPGGAVDTHEHAPTLTERRIDAMMGLLRDDKRQLWKTDENRRTIEAMTPQFYEGSAYYARWVYAMRSLLIEKGVLTEAEIEQRLAAVRARLAPPQPPAAKVKTSTKTKGKRGGRMAQPAGAAGGAPSAQASPTKASAKASKMRAGVKVKGEPERGAGGGGQP